MTKNNGGPAFPVAFPDSDRDNHYVAYGMTLRDHFAGLAMQAELISGVCLDEFPEHASRAYKMADEMLKAREA